MKFIIAFSIIAVIILSGCSSKQYDTRRADPSRYSNFSTIDEEYDYDDGYSWAEDNDIDNFDDCQSQFGTSEAEDGCNDYIKDNYTGNDTFYGYECTEDCSGHEAGYNWAESNDISDIYDCDGNSQSFNEGCQAYVEENY